MRSLVVIAALSLPTFGVALAHAQDAPPPPRAQEEVPTTEEAQRAQAAAHAQASSAPLTSTATTEEPSPTAPASTPEPAGSTHTSRHGDDASLSTAVFPRPPPSTPEEPEPELEEELTLPPPEPEWRLRLGVGATAATGGGPTISLRLTQELEWMPHEVAPVLFSLTGGEVFGDYTMGLGGVRIGLYGMFCRDRIVTCTGAVALRGGVIGGTPGVAFDLGGDGDARFRFDGVELAVRVGFFVIQSTTFVDLLGMVGAAF